MPDIWADIQQEIELFREIVLDGNSELACRTLARRDRVGMRASLQRRMCEMENACEGCSACCENNEAVVTENDISRMSDCLGMVPEEFAEVSLRLKEDGRCYLRHTPCEFLVDQRCTIYPVRPTICVLYPFLSDAPDSDTIRLRKDCKTGWQVLADGDHRNAYPAQLSDNGFVEAA